MTDIVERLRARMTWGLAHDTSKDGELLRDAADEIAYLRTLPRLPPEEVVAGMARIAARNASQRAFYGERKME